MDDPPTAMSVGLAERETVVLQPGCAGPSMILPEGRTQYVAGESVGWLPFLDGAYF